MLTRHQTMPALCQFHARFRRQARHLTSSCALLVGGLVVIVASRGVLAAKAARCVLPALSTRCVLPKAARSVLASKATRVLVLSGCLTPELLDALTYSALASVACSIALGSCPSSQTSSNLHCSATRLQLCSSMLARCLLNSILRD